MIRSCASTSNSRKPKSSNCLAPASRSQRKFSVLWQKFHPQITAAAPYRPLMHTHGGFLCGCSDARNAGRPSSLKIGSASNAGTRSAICRSACELLTLNPMAKPSSRSGNRTAFRYCENAAHGACNWLISGDSPENFCPACRHNQRHPGPLDQGEISCAGSAWNRPSTGCSTRSSPSTCR